MNVFVDTSAFYAVLSRTDSNHQSAYREWNRLMNDESVRFYTSNYVIVETCALISSRLGDKALHSFVQDLLPVVAVLWIDQTIHTAATEAMLAHGRNGPSLVDCSSFALMREVGVTNALAYDKHFAGQGFSL